MHAAAKGFGKKKNDDDDDEKDVKPRRRVGDYEPVPSASTLRMKDALEDDEEMLRLLTDERVKGLIVLLRNCEPDEYVEVFNEHYAQDPFMREARDKIFRFLGAF